MEYIRFVLEYEIYKISERSYPSYRLLENPCLLCDGLDPWFRKLGDLLGICDDNYMQGMGGGVFIEKGLDIDSRKRLDKKFTIIVTISVQSWKLVPGKVVEAACNDYPHSKVYFMMVEKGRAKGGLGKPWANDEKIQAPHAAWVYQNSVPQAICKNLEAMEKSLWVEVDEEKPIEEFNTMAPWILNRSATR